MEAHHSAPADKSTSEQIAGRPFQWPLIPGEPQQAAATRPRAAASSAEHCGCAAAGLLLLGTNGALTTGYSANGQPCASKPSLEVPCSLRSSCEVLLTPEASTAPRSEVLLAASTSLLFILSKHYCYLLHFWFGVASASWRTLTKPSLFYVMLCKLINFPHLRHPRDGSQAWETFLTSDFLLVHYST